MKKILITLILGFFSFNTFAVTYAKHTKHTTKHTTQAKKPNTHKQVTHKKATHTHTEQHHSSIKSSKEVNHDSTGAHVANNNYRHARLQ